jgi:hypothetical protein
METVKQSLLDMIIDFISRRKIAALERAFKGDQKLMATVKRMNDTYAEIDNHLTEYCKKYPERCKDAEERENKFRYKG